MDDNDLRSLWLDDENRVPDDSEKIRDWIRRRSRSAYKGIDITLVIYGVAQIGIVMLALANLLLSPTALTAWLALLVTTSASGSFASTLFVWLRWKQVRGHNTAVIDQQQMLAAFFNRTYACWLLIAALTPALATLAVIVMVETFDGGFSINSPILFSGLLGGIILITFIGNQVTTGRVRASDWARICDVADIHQNFISKMRNEIRRDIAILLLALGGVTSVVIYTISLL